MERLTKQLDDVCVYIGPGCKYNNGEIPAEIAPWNVRKVLQRLAAYEDTDLEPEEVKELAQAKKDGGLVVLPCKVGDLVYVLWDIPTECRYAIYCSEVKEVRVSRRNCRLTTAYLMEPIEFRGRRREYRDDDFGKTVFLTREEAEAALEAQKGEKYETDL